MEEVLVVEDDVRMQKVLTRIFSRDGFVVRTAGNGAAALEMFSKQQPSVVLLDLVLPEISGRDVCKLIKAKSPETPVIILSSISDVVDKVLLLEMGADDYVTKPFSPRELLARVQAAIRRQKRSRPTAEPTVFQFGRCVIDFERMTAICEGVGVILTSLEFKLLRYFMSNVGLVLSRDTLLNKVWGYNAYPSTRTVDNQVLKIASEAGRRSGESYSPSHYLWRRIQVHRMTCEASVQCRSGCRARALCCWLS